VGAVAEGHERAAERVAVDGAADLDEPPGSEMLRGAGRWRVTSSELDPSSSAESRADRALAPSAQRLLPPPAADPGSGGRGVWAPKRYGPAIQWLESGRTSGDD